ncbi:MAG: hypothetical protein IJW08_06020 [Lentisphaeria bacterium]|nr:hypothetical protein [Lentisphaeria bacterium]MBR7119946.1 hypothetical protein [Lentisphaeria bacterium]
MTDQAKIKAMQEMLEAVITINEVITGIHNLPILEKLNREIKSELSIIQSDKE